MGRIRHGWVPVAQVLDIGILTNWGCNGQDIVVLFTVINKRSGGRCMEKNDGEKIVARFRDGRLLKGFVRNFSIESDTVILNDQNTNKENRIPIAELKAIFFVKNFEGSSHYVERKVFGIRKNLGRKVFVKFIDKEALVGFIEGEIPWDRGFSLAKLGESTKGFFLTPVDGDSNNERVFVVGSAIENVTIMVR
jgi:hypothetical protein